MVVDNERGDGAKRYPVSLIRESFSMDSDRQAMNILSSPEAGRPMLDVVAGQLTYWKQRLGGAGTILEVPTDRPHRLEHTFVNAHCSFELSPSLTAALKLLSLHEEVSLFTTLLTAFQTLLYCYSGQVDLLVGTPVAGHHRPDRVDLIGPFANILVVRSELSGNPSFRELLGRGRAIVLEAYDNQDVPFEQVVQSIRLKFDASRNPLFQVMFALTDAPLVPLDEDEQSLHSIKPGVGGGQTQVDLTLIMQETMQGLTGSIEYNADLFESATIVRMISHWQRLLESIIADPNRRISDLALLSDAEWHQQVVEWNATQTAYPQNQCFHELFEAQVERTPGAVAVVFEQEQFTYRELNQRANQLAHYLQKLEVGPETLVALLLERSIYFVVAILAVFKAGGAFLPLSPEHPVKRHCQVLKQSGCHLMLTTDMYGSKLLEALVESDSGQRPQMLHIDSCLQKSEAEENLPLRSVPGNLAYVMYTSGSTGMPKGVMVEQAGMVNHIYAKIADLSVSMEDRIAQNGPPCFDIVVWQCLAALLVGGSVHIFKDEIAHDPKQLLEQIEVKKITILQAVPSILRAVIQQATMLGEERPRLANLRWAVPTGDALPPELCRQWLQLYPAIPLLNTYGSTECSDDQCHYAIYQPPALDYPLPIMPIGRPIQNMRAYILDQQLMPVPIGVVGDLYIGGIGVGRGYLHDAERTAEVFLPDPFAEEPGARLYKTRDRARYLTDGSIEFLGRTDHLVKIHGVRIEPGEIEAVLERYTAVQEAIVIAKEAVGSNKYLVAYIVPIQGQTPTSEELRPWLREKLPEYMIPTAFVLLDSIPLNSNGKVDRRALPAPEHNRSERDENFVAPTLSIHQQLIQIWEELLEVRPIGIRDNFFEVGGHSLLAVRLIYRIEQVWGRKVLPATLLAGPTIEELATVLQRQEESDLEPALGAVQENGFKQPLISEHKPLLSSIKRIWARSRSKGKLD